MTNLLREGLVQAGWMPTGWEWIVLLVIVLLLFGPKRLPQLSRSIGRSIRDFKRGLNDIKDEVENIGEENEEEDRAKTAPQAEPPKDSRPVPDARDKGEKDA